MSEYPVGATWQGIDKHGMIGRIWLLSRSGTGQEFWHWGLYYPNGIQKRGWEGGDWETSYRMCKNMLPIDCRMKRLK